MNKKYFLLISFTTVVCGFVAYSLTNKVSSVPEVAFQPVIAPVIESKTEISDILGTPKIPKSLQQENTIKGYEILSENEDFIYVEKSQTGSMPSELTIIGDSGSVKAKFIDISENEYISCGEKSTRYLAKYELEQNFKMNNFVGLYPVLNVTIDDVKLDFKKENLPSELRALMKDLMLKTSYHTTTEPFDELLHNCSYFKSQKFEEIRCGYIALFMDNRNMIAQSGTDYGMAKMELLNIFKIENKKYYLFEVGVKGGTAKSLYSEDGNSISITSGDYQVICD